MRCQCVTLEDYIEKLKADPAEMPLLFRDLLIRVTSFFRDQETFDPGLEGHPAAV